MSQGHIPALPHVVVQYRDDLTADERGREWEIETTFDPASSRADVVNRRMVYSDVDDEFSRLFRVRETLRARVSLTSKEQWDAVEESKVNSQILEKAEELRLFSIMRELNYDTDILAEDPGIKFRAQRLAKLGTEAAYRQLAIESIPLIKSRGFNQLISGVRSVNKDWASSLRDLVKGVNYYSDFTDMDTRALTSVEPTRLNSGQVPEGFLRTIKFAKDFQYHLDSRVRSMEEEFLEKVKPLSERDKKSKTTEEISEYEKERIRKLMERADPEGKPIPGDISIRSDFPVGDGEFAALVIDDTIPLTTLVSGYLHRRKRSNFYGKRLSYPSRMLTDPSRRVFGEKVRAKGGVVVIDVSGSMSLDIKDVEQVLEAAPGALVMAYSHKGWGDDSEPNLTILAKEGKRVEEIPDCIFRGGNGVDGPALLYALRVRHSKEPVVWVCDGMVTSAHDGMSDRLTREVAELVMRHGIIQIPNVNVAVEQFKTRRFRNIPVGAVGEFVRNARNKDTKR